MAPVILLPNPPPVYSLMKTTLSGLDAQPSRYRGDGLRGALRAGVNVDLAVLPVRHRGASLQGLVARVRRDERFVKHERGVLETRVEIAERPFIGRLAHRQLALFGLGEVRLGPLEFPDLGRRHRCRAARRIRRRCGSHPDIALSSRIRPAGPQGFERIDDKRQRLEIDPNLFNRFGGSELVDRGHGENRLALVQRLHREPAISLLVCHDHGAVIGHAIGRSGEIVRGENRLDAWHRQRCARIDVLDARVWHRAEQQLAEQHAVRAIVLGVLRLARHLRDEIGRRVVLADQLVIGRGHVSSHGYAFLMFSAPRIIAVRILS